MEGEVHDQRYEEEPTSPLVFQCGSCRAILGDSWSFQCSDADLGIVCLASITGVTFSDADVLMSKSGKDAGSTFVQLFCKSCKVIVGRKYLTTAQDLDAVRGQYSLLVEMVCSYELGSADIVLEDSESNGAVGRKRGRGNNVMYSQHVALTISELATRAVVLQTNLYKVQKVLLQYNERLSVLEKDNGVTWEDVQESEPPTKKRKNSSRV